MQKIVDISNLEVLSENGEYKKTEGLLITEQQKVIELYFEDESFIKCTENHLLKTKTGWKKAKDLELYESILDKNDKEILVIGKEKSKTKENVYDFINVEDTHCYIANEIKNHNCIIMDEFSFVPNNVAEEFFSSVFPAVTAGKTTKIVIISTPNGMNLFYRIWLDATTGKSDYVAVEAKWNEVPGRDENFKKTVLANFAGNKEARWRGEYEVEFMGSDNTLISPSKLTSLYYKNPIITTQEGYTVFEKPEPEKRYIICVDPSRGSGIDYHAISVIDCTSVPYKVAATFRNNELSVQLLPNVINKIALQYNQAYVLIEINDLGLSVANALRDEMEYENIVEVIFHPKRGQRAHSGWSGKPMPGLNMSYAVKGEGCQILKDFIENDKLILNDFNIVSEFSTFIRGGASHTTKTKSSISYGASEGNHDDLVMSLVSFAWLTGQQFFKDYTDTNVKEKLFEDKIRRLEEDVMPFGFIANGIDDPENDTAQDINWLSNGKTPQELAEENKKLYKNNDW